MGENNDSPTVNVRDTTSPLQFRCVFRCGRNGLIFQRFDKSKPPDRIRTSGIKQPKNSGHHELGQQSVRQKADCPPSHPPTSIAYFPPHVASGKPLHNMLQDDAEISPCLAMSSAAVPQKHLKVEKVMKQQSRQETGGGGKGRRTYSYLLKLDEVMIAEPQTGVRPSAVLR